MSFSSARARAMRGLPCLLIAGLAVAGCSSTPEPTKTTGSYYEGAMKPKSPGGGTPAGAPAAGAPGAPAPATPRGGGSVDN
ncbi:MAG: hypothetical protein ACKO5K_17485 [Armatimonadota bacterium]